MKNKKTVFLALLVMLLTCSMLLTGCTEPATDSTESATDKTEQTSETTSEATEEPVEEEPIEISYWSFWCANADDGNYCESIIEDELNIDIKTIMISQNEIEQLTLLLASGEMPDCGWFNNDFDYMYYTNELTRTIPKDLIEQYAPGFANMFDEYPILEKYVTTTENENECYALPTYHEYTAGRQYFHTDFYRKDWLDALGIDYPGGVEEVVDGVYMCETGYTWEEHKAILEAFTNDDPDGNGENDTVGSMQNPVNRTLLGSYGLTKNFSVEDNGKAVYCYSTERYKEILEYASGLYMEGLIDAEVFTMDSAQFYEKAQNSYGGHFNVSCNWLSDWAASRPPLNILNNVEGAEILVTPGLIGPDGQMGSAYYLALPECSDTYYYVNKNVTDENKLIAILEFADYANFGDEKVTLMFGEEGVDFTYDENGIPVRSEDYVAESDRGILAYANWIRDEEALSYLDSYRFQLTYKYTVGDGSWIQYLIGPYKYDLYNETDLAELTSDYGSTLDTLVGEFRVGVITGETDLDVEWDNYIQSLNNSGYDEICEELDKAPLYADLMSSD